MAMLSCMALFMWLYLLLSPSINRRHPEVFLSNFFALLIWLSVASFRSMENISLISSLKRHGIFQGWLHPSHLRPTPLPEILLNSHHWSFYFLVVDEKCPYITQYCKDFIVVLIMSTMEASNQLQYFTDITVLAIFSNPLPPSSCEHRDNEHCPNMIGNACFSFSSYSVHFLCCFSKSFFHLKISILSGSTVIIFP